MKIFEAGPLRSRVEPNLPGFFLALAFFCGGLRLPGAWLAFAALFLPWAALDRAPFAPERRPAALLFFTWLALAALFAPQPAVVAGALGRYLLPGLFFFCAAARGGEKNWLGAVLVLGAVSAAALLLQKITGRAAVGLIGMNPNYTAAFAAASFPAALLYAGGEQKQLRLPAAALALLLAAGLLAAGSRGALLAAVVSAAAALALARRGRTLAVLGFAALAAFVLLPGSFWSAVLKFGDARAFERPQLWAAALKAASQHPFFGAGPGLFERAFEFVKFPFFDGISYYGHSTAHAHSELLNLAAEAGFPAALLFAAAFAGGIRAGIKRSLPLAACALALFIQGSVDIVFYSGAIALLFWGTLGFLAPREQAEAGSGKKPKVALALLCGGALSLGVTAEYFPFGLKLQPQSYAQAAAGNSPALGLALRLRETLENPKDPFAARRAGSAAAAAGDFYRAEAYLRKALELEPFYAAARLELAEVYAAQGRRAESCAALSAVGRPLSADPVNQYQRGLVYFNRQELRRLETGLCGKKAGRR
ncbi:MAG TPA: O-antigen ligase family protein [Elusimicrobiales bacterium]|nr:O-antigen ligase family protein [Elusimicrobiales bacterium]